MKRVEVEVEHYFQKKFVGRKRILPSEQITIIGQTKECGLRLLGDGVSNVHACIEFYNDQWVVADLGSEQGTWVRKKAIVSHVINSSTSVNIGQHELKIFPKVIESHLFTEETSVNQNRIDIQNVGTLNRYHQVILKKNSFVVESKLLPVNEPFVYYQGLKKHNLLPPKGDEWKTENFGDVTIQQRIVCSSVVEESSAEKVAVIWDPNLKGPLALALVLLLILTSLFILHPGSFNSEMEELKPETDNKYTRMIFDANAIRKKREQAKQVRNSMSTRSTNMAAPQMSKELKVTKSESQSSSKVVNKIKSAELSQLIGKISKRASHNAQFIKAVGATPDGNSTARVLATVGNEASKLNANKNGNFKVDGVKTAGKAGGSNSYKKIGGLALGNVGTATVGVLDEETEVEGGLDKDLIARVIEKNLGQIRYCYERQLSANPDLYGKVLVKFTIGGDGAVKAQNIGSTTLKSAMVEGCILRRVSGWMFPQPKGGTHVLVTYPFLFKSTN